MKTIAKILSLVMMVSMISVPVYADTTSNRIDYFADALIEMDNEFEESYLELFELLITLDDSKGMLKAYTSAMNSMAGGEKTKLEAMKKVLESMQVMSEDVIDDEFTFDVFKSYVKNDKSDQLKTALNLRSDAVEDALADMDQATIDAGFKRIKKMFTLQGVAIGFNASFILITTEKYGKLYTYDEGITIIANMSNIMDQVDEINVDDLKNAIQQLAEYYNSSSQGDLLFDYFDDNGLIKVDAEYGSTGSDTGTSSGSGAGAGPSVGNTTGASSPTVPTSPTLPTSPVEEDLGADAEVPEGIALFSDIGRYTWAWMAIRQLYIADVIKGKNENEFDPSGNISRAEFSALLSRLLETEIPSDSPTLEGIFDDVNADKWYYKEVMAAFRAGYVNGVGSSRFEPQANINREQIATILSRVLSSRGLDTIDTRDIDIILNEFEDAADVSSWASSACAMLADLGVITGVTREDKKYFDFNKNASRAEVSVMLYRVAELIETKVIVE